MPRPRTSLQGCPSSGRGSHDIAAALIDVAPYDDGSGQRHRERHIKVAVAGLSGAIYMPLPRTTRDNRVIMAFCDRLIVNSREPR